MSNGYDSEHYDEFSSFEASEDDEAWVRDYRGQWRWVPSGYRPPGSYYRPPLYGRPAYRPPWFSRPAYRPPSYGRPAYRPPAYQQPGPGMGQPPAPGFDQPPAPASYAPPAPGFAQPAAPASYQPPVSGFDQPAFAGPYQPSYPMSYGGNGGSTGDLVTAALPALQDLLKPANATVTDADTGKSVEVPQVNKSTLGKLLPYAPLAYLLIAGPRGVLNAGPGATNSAFVSLAAGVVGGLIAEKLLDKDEESTNPS